MKIVMDKRIPGLLEGLHSLMPGELEILALEGPQIKREDVKDAEVLFVRTRTRCDESLLKDSKVKLIGSATIGIEHIDIPWCENSGIRVINAPGCNAPAVMQYVACSLNKAGFDLSRHTLGVVGKGSIGSLVVELYRRAGAKVIVCDPPREASHFNDEVYLPIEELLQNCDAVTFHVPYTSEGPYPTHHLLSTPLPEKLKIIINASRGLVINPEIITSDKKFIIDTWSFEDCVSLISETEKGRLIDSAFIATPHIAGYSIEGKQRATAAMLRAFAEYVGISHSQNMEKTDEKKYNYNLSDVVLSFDPTPLSNALKHDPDKFESLRANHLRKEPQPEKN